MKINMLLVEMIFMEGYKASQKGYLNTEPFHKAELRRQIMALVDLVSIIDRDASANGKDKQYGGII